MVKTGENTMEYLVYSIIVLSVAFSTWAQLYVHGFCLAHFPRLVGEQPTNWWNGSRLRRTCLQNARIRSKK